MRSSAVSVALIALLASPAFAAPMGKDARGLSLGKTSSTSGTSTASQIGGSIAGGAASAVVGNLLNEIEGLFRRGDETLAARGIADIIKSAQTLSDSDKATVKTALVNKIGTLQNAPQRRGLSLGKTSSTSGTSTASQIGGSIAGGAASAVVGNLLNEIEGLFRRGAPVEEEPPAPAEEPASTTNPLISSAVGGAAGAAVNNLLTEIEKLFRRDSEFGMSRRGLASIVQQASTLSDADKATVKTALVNKISTLKNAQRRGLSLGKTSSTSGTSTASQIGGSIAGGAASAVVGNLLNEIEGLFRRGDDTLAARGIADIIKSAQTLSDADKATVKTALVNKIGTLQNAPQRRGLSLGKTSSTSGTSTAGQIGGSIAGGAASAVVGNLLNEIEGLFRRDTPEERGIAGSIGGSLAGGAASAVVSNLLGEIESLFRREMPEERGIGSSIGGSIAGGAASAVVSNLLGEIESLFRRDEQLAARSLAGTAIGGIASVGTNTVVGDLLNKIESLFRRADDESTLLARTEDWSINELD